MWLKVLLIPDTSAILRTGWRLVKNRVHQTIKIMSHYTPQVYVTWMGNWVTFEISPCPCVSSKTQALVNKGKSCRKQRGLQNDEPSFYTFTVWLVSLRKRESQHRKSTWYSTLTTCKTLRKYLIGRIDRLRKVCDNRGNWIHVNVLVMSNFWNFSTTLLYIYFIICHKN